MGWGADVPEVMASEPGALSGGELLPLGERECARRALTWGQGLVGALAAGVVAGSSLVWPRWTLLLLTGLLVAGYMAVVADRALLVCGGRRPGLFVTVSDAQARAVADVDLPVYTVLVPAYREPEVLAGLLSALKGLEYPREKLDVRLLLEEDDELTRAQAERLGADAVARIVVVPPSWPRTKPKACNVGLAAARGQYVTIYDAEDRPEPLQLRRAVVAFTRVEARVVCLQSVLAYYNAGQNFITRCFAAEYMMWFRWLLPGLVRRGAAIPLGGTSNHFRRRALLELGGWDPWNVTEDADLGIRLHRRGLRTALLDSVTFEEANCDFVNWVKQRSRWYKGYLVTCLVHLRSPRLLRAQIGTGPLLGMVLFVGGTPLLAAANLLFWLLTLSWFAGLSQVGALFPPVLFYPALVCAVVGNTTLAYLHLLAAHESGEPRAVTAALAVPVYWAMMSVAACKALIQLATAPAFWEKTVHGLAGDRGRDGPFTVSAEVLPQVAP